MFFLPNANEHATKVKTMFIEKIIFYEIYENNT